MKDHVKNNAKRWPHTIDGRCEDEAGLIEFLSANLDMLLDAIRDHGAVLLRGFDGLGADALQQLAEIVSGSLMEYKDRGARRTLLRNRVYTSADYPPEHEIFLHNESTYSVEWPMKVFLHCVRPAKSGGETLIADVRRVLQRLSSTTVDSFIDGKVMYVRNFGMGPFTATWQETFQTHDPNEMMDYCRESQIMVEWLDASRVRTRQIRPAVVEHPLTGDRVWFNHAAALHVTTLRPPIRNAVLRLFPKKDYPSNAYFGNGADIPIDILDEIRHAYRSESKPINWRTGDFLILDNMLVAHGRAPFSGDRQVMVAMTEPRSWADVRSISRSDII